MKQISAALSAECLKQKHSKIFWVTLIVFLIIPVMMGLMMLVARHPETAKKLGLVGTKATLFATNDWNGFIALLNQTVATMGLIGFGFVTGWVFGREYIDRTVKDILALPISRDSIIYAKFLVVYIWCTSLIIAMFLGSLTVGHLIAIPGWSFQVFAHFTRTFFITYLLTLIISTPVAFFASYGQGIVAPIGFVIFTLVMAQFISIVGLGPYFPWAIPGIFTVSDIAQGMHLVPSSYVILGATSFAGIAGTIMWWNYADQH